MKHKIVLVFLFFLSVMPGVPAPQGSHMRVPTLPAVEYNRLRTRLEVFPELYELFSALHAPATRLQRRLYARKRIEFEQVLKLYELSGTLVRDVKRFNKKMKPRVLKAWWKRKEVLTPAAIVGALAVAAAGGYWWKQNKDARRAQGDTGSAAVREPIGPELVTKAERDAVEPVVVVDTGLPGAGVVAGGLRVHTDGRINAFDSPSQAGAGASVVLGRGEAATGVASAQAIVISDSTITEHLNILGHNGGCVMVGSRPTYPDVQFFMECVQPNNWQPYAHSSDPYAQGYKKSFMYDRNTILNDPSFTQAIPRIVAALAAANVALVDENKGQKGPVDIDAPWVQALIDRFLLITHFCMFLEQTSVGRRIISSQILTQDILVNMAYAGTLEQSCVGTGSEMKGQLPLNKFIINSFAVRAGLQESIIDKIQYGVTQLKGAKQYTGFKACLLSAALAAVRAILGQLLTGNADLRSRAELNVDLKERGKLVEADRKHDQIRDAFDQLQRLQRSGGASV